jgi:hypothetical protein
MKDIREQAEEEFNKWFENLPYRKENDGPARGDLTAARGM